MQNAQAIIQQIEQQSQAHTADERFVRTIQVGQVIRQGDIYLHRVEDNHSKGEAIADRQLAPGTSKGSRHVVAGNVDLFAGTVSSGDFGDALTGPVIQARERFCVTHPEHADVSVPSGTYQVGYQADPRTRARVAD